MAAVRHLSVGTEDGVVVLSEKDGGWEVGAKSLAGKVAGELVASGSGTVYCAASGDGVYASNDRGKTWDRVLEGDVRAVAVDPRNPWTVYVGTEPVHLYRSQDGGDNWTEIAGLQRMPEEVQEKWWFPNPPHDGHVCSIFIDSDDPQVIMLGLEHGGIVRSRDGGETWEDLSAGIEYLDIHMVTRDPGDRHLWYAATARGFYRSEHDGYDWVFSTAGMDRDYFHHFVVRPGSPSSLFLATANGSPPSWLRDGGARSAIYRSEDGGRTWHQLTGGLPPSLKPMVWAVVGDPANDARLYAAVSDYTAHVPKGETPKGEVWASPDRGDTWERIYETDSAVRTLCVSL